MDFSKSYRTAYRLLCDPEILDRQVLLPGAIMEDFVRVLGTNLQMYQWMALALLAIQLWSHYRYFRQGAVSVLLEPAAAGGDGNPAAHGRDAATVLWVLHGAHTGCVPGVRTVAEATAGRLGNFVVEPACPAEWRLEILQ